MSEKISDLIAAAKNNDDKALYAIYEHLIEPKLSESDRERLFDWVHRSAELGSATSMFALGCYYEAGFGLTQNEKTAFDWFVKSANAGHSTAFWSVGMAYKNGIGITKNYSKAIEWFEKAIETFDGEMLSEEELGSDRCYVNDENVAWWKAVALRSSPTVKYPEVPFCVALHYHLSKDNDLARAMPFYKIAAEQGHKYAQRDLGRFLYEGTGIEKNAQQAMHWLEKAALQDVAPAMYYLGKLYADDRSEAFDMEKAVFWWMRLVRCGDEEAPGLVELELSWCFALGVGIDQVEQGEYEYSAESYLVDSSSNLPTRGSVVVDEDSWWYRKVKQGDAFALYWMGMCYSQLDQLIPYGDNNKDACTLSCFRRAAEMGCVEAQHSVAWFLCHGPKSVRDEEEGLRWYRLAAKQGHPDSIDHLKDFEVKNPDQDKDMTDEFTATYEDDIAQDEDPEDAEWPRTVLIRPKVGEVINQLWDEDYDPEEDGGVALTSNQGAMIESLDIESWGDLQLPSGYELYDENDRAAYNAYLGHGSRIGEYRF